MGQMAGPVIGSAIGGIMANKAAKKDRDAQRYAAELMTQPYRDAAPYIKNLYERGQSALDAALATGAYQGPTYAGMDPRAQQGYNYMTSTADNIMGIPASLMQQGQGFGTNYQDIYNRASRNTLDDAVNYATGGSSQGLVDSAMRDSTRRLNERTLPGIGMNASATGNTNSSRAGVAEAIAQRAYDDRRADVTAQIEDRMVDRFRTQNNQDIRNMMSANQGLGKTFAAGFGMIPDVSNLYTQAGGAFQADEQGRMDANRAAFERDRDFRMDQLNTYGSAILGQAPRSTNMNPITANPYTATLGGAMSGFGFGNKIADMFSKTPQVAPTAYAPSFTGQGMFGINPRFEPVGF
tara:strand:+ start:769 stop:1821 length:1053 start_codon:yes stop_codon:yes gene_type:complete